MALKGAWHAVALELALGAMFTDHQKTLREGALAGQRVVTRAFFRQELKFSAARN
jgi:hypothetical protein